MLSLFSLCTVFLAHVTPVPTTEAPAGAGASCGTFTDIARHGAAAGPRAATRRFFDDEGVEVSQSGAFGPGREQAPL